MMVRNLNFRNLLSITQEVERSNGFLDSQWRTAVPEWPDDVGGTPFTPFFMLRDSSLLDIFSLIYVVRSREQIAHDLVSYIADYCHGWWIGEYWMSQSRNTKRSRKRKKPIGLHILSFFFSKGPSECKRPFMLSTKVLCLKRCFEWLPRGGAHQFGKWLGAGLNLQSNAYLHENVMSISWNTSTGPGSVLS